MKRLVLDLESDGLLQELTKIHCVAIVDLDSDYEELFTDVNKALEVINQAEELIGHNIYNFDLKALEKIHNIDLTKTHKIHDTMILSQVLFPNLKDLDFSRYKVPYRYVGSHSLAAWGHRLGEYKDEYDKGWETYSDEMGEYCLQDTRVTKAKFIFDEETLAGLEDKQDFIELEYAIAPILARQQATGVEFDRDGADLLQATLIADKNRLKQDLQNLFQPRVVSLGEFTPQRDDKKYHYKKGATFTRIKFEEYNPGSRIQTIDRLCKELGWEPSEFTDKGNPELDEEIIESLPFPRIKPLKDYYIIGKRLGQLADGKQAWMRKVKSDGRIYGGLLQSGTITGRMSHFNPNLAQVPACDKPYGKDCRSLFRASPGKILVGCDADALEMRTLACYLTSIDGGSFRDTLLAGKKEDGTDMHSINAQAYQVDLFEGGRDCSKTLFYGSLYGCGNAKRGLIIQQYGIDFRQYHPDFDKCFKGMKRWATQKNKDWSDKYIECFVIGQLALERFGEKLPSLPTLIERVTKKWEERGYILGLDGRRLLPRKKTAVFNTLNQSAGAIIMKKALQISDNTLQLDYVPGKDYEFILNIHDEWQLEVIDQPEVIDNVRKILEDSIVKAGEFFSLPCPMKGNSAVGKNWAETH